jgi:hypothetical protein
MTWLSKLPIVVSAVHEFSAIPYFIFFLTIACFDCEYINPHTSDHCRWMTWVHQGFGSRRRFEAQFRTKRFGPTSGYQQPTPLRRLQTWKKSPNS